jgi:hypothetical protein
MIKILINNNYLLICILSFFLFNHRCDNFSIIFNLNNIFLPNIQECIICFIKRKCIYFLKSIIFIIFIFSIISFAAFVYFISLCFMINYFLYDYK